MAELAAELPPGQRFDSFIVDEAQDFADNWWTPLLRAMRDEETGGLYVYSDENQRIFARFGQPPVPLVPLVLDHNLRNTKQIHECFGPLAPTRMTSRGGDGADVHFIPADDRQGDRRGRRGGRACCSTSAGSPATSPCSPRATATTSRSRRPSASGTAGYWRTFWDDEEVFYGHVLGCKGLERPAVVLCLNESAGRDRSREKLYVGMSRATDHLIVVGDPDVVREIGGPAVATRLGI